MSSDDDRIVYEEQAERPAAKVGTLVGAGLAVIVAMALLGWLGSPLDTQSDSLPEISAPAQVPLAVMPDLTGHSFVTVLDLLRDAGLDSTIVRQAQWRANPDTPAGEVSSQSPPSGTDIFDMNDVSLVMSAGGPITSWDGVPVGLQQLTTTTYEPDRSEPVLIVETGSGRAYKTDDLLFGPCDAVAVAKYLVYDRSFDELCQPRPPETIVGWLADGSMFAVEGVPHQQYLDLASAMILTPDHPFGRQLWSTSTERRAPAVIVDDRTIRVMGGYYSFVLKIEVGAGIDAAEIAALIDPVDIRGNLVVNLTPPMEYFLQSGITGQAAEFGTAARRYRGPDDQPFGGVSTADIVSGPDGVEVAIDEAYLVAARVTTVAPTAWTVVQTGDWQYAIPSGWMEGERLATGGSSRSISAATFESTNLGDWCGSYPVGSLREVGPGDAFLSIYFDESTDFVMWPAHFNPDDVPTVSTDDPGVQCLEGVAAEVRTSSRFYNGYAIKVVLALGSELDDETRKQAFAILDSFEPKPDYDLP